MKKIAIISGFILILTNLRTQAQTREMSITSDSIMISMTTKYSNDSVMLQYCFYNLKKLHIIIPDSAWINGKVISDDRPALFISSINSGREENKIKYKILNPKEHYCYSLCFPKIGANRIEIEFAYIDSEEFYNKIKNDGRHLINEYGFSCASKSIVITDFAP